MGDLLHAVSYLLPLTWACDALAHVARRCERHGRTRRGDRRRHHGRALGLGATTLRRRTA
jgi:hypothetical protein